MSDVPEARPSSTVVLLRDANSGLETLLLKRNKALFFAGGLWVFPGGALDPEDFDGVGDDVVAASRIAAAREAQEESGLLPHLEDMVLLSHWITPVVEPKRFSTWIYAAPLAADDEVVIDGGEIHDSRWIGVRDAIAEHEVGELAMLPPTYITLRGLVGYDTVAQMVAVERDSPVPEVLPVVGDDKGRRAVMFRGDAGYDSADASTEGARHRAILNGKHWEYVYRDVPADIPSLISL
ncbi:MAG: NUDIX hydrolase [Gammaproteobacteria bacterium]|nr:MAG: NUDIX hydrolase [Gammaproteobacteria bacterium]RLA59422.1 MAG: NUDIX hydrolase [Gammaproteobacteria bacterium]